MKIATTALLVGLVAWNASADRKYTVTKPTYEQSNQVILDKVLGELGVGAALKRIVPQSASVAVISMDGFTRPEQKSDWPFVAMFEDQLIGSIVGNGFKVVERDDDIVRQLIVESTVKNLSLTPAQVSDIVGYAPLVKADSIVVKVDSTAKAVEALLRNNLPSLEKGLVSTTLPGADYLVSYRVQEMGILYRNDLMMRNQKLREARVRVFVRVHEVKTGSVVLANTFESSYEDTVATSVISQLANFYYTPYGHTNPLPGKEVDKSTVSNHYQFEPSTGENYLSASLYGAKLGNGGEFNNSGDLEIKGYGAGMLFGLGFTKVHNRGKVLGDTYLEGYARGGFESKSVTDDLKRTALGLQLGGQYQWRPYEPVLVGGGLNGRFDYLNYQVTGGDGTKSNKQAIAFGVLPTAELSLQMEFRGVVVIRPFVEYELPALIGTSKGQGLMVGLKLGYVR